jgi:sugar phosphate isomerase/epimerase
MDRLGIGFLCVFGLPPLEFVDLAADRGCRHISIFLRGMALVPLRYPPFSFKEDGALRKDTIAALGDRGVTISLGDGFLVLSNADVHAFSADLDAMAELGAPRSNTVSLDPDRARTFDQFAALAELASQRDIQTVVEPAPGLAVGDIPTAVAALKHVGRPDFQILIDTMRLVRSGSSATSLCWLLSSSARAAEVRRHGRSRRSLSCSRPHLPVLS